MPWQRCRCTDYTQTVRWTELTVHTMCVGSSASQGKICTVEREKQLQQSEIVLSSINGIVHTTNTCVLEEHMNSACLEIVQYYYIILLCNVLPTWDEKLSTRHFYWFFSPRKMNGDTVININNFQVGLTIIRPENNHWSTQLVITDPPVLSTPELCHTMPTHCAVPQSVKFHGDVHTADTS